MPSGRRKIHGESHGVSGRALNWEIEGPYTCPCDFQIASELMAQGIELWLSLNQEMMHHARKSIEKNHRLLDMLGSPWED